MQSFSSARGSSAVASRRGAVSQSFSACAAPRTNSVVAASASASAARSNKQLKKSIAAASSASSAPSRGASVVAQAVAAAPAVTSGARSAAKTDVPKEQQKPTAVITGASSGLGLAAAIALAKKGD